MARFRFRLAALRRLREIRRDELQARLSEAVRAQDVLDDQAARLGQQLTALVETQRQQLASRSPNVNRLLEAQRYALALQAMQRTLDQQRSQLAQEVEARRRAVVEADREVRVLDRLAEKQLAAHRRAEQSAEQRILDEIGGQRYALDRETP
jgi:flagellar FliJ protein